jgi:hypothetical protein
METGTPALQGEGVKTETYQTQLYLNPSWVPYAEYKNKELWESAPKEKLLDLFASAKSADLEKDFTTARIYYLKMMDMRLSHDWPQAEREALRYSIERLSKISLPENKKSWSGLLANGRRRAVPREWKGFSIALINGEKFDLNQKNIILPRAEFRLSLLSNTYEHQSFVIDSSQIPLLDIRKKTLAHARCEGELKNTNNIPANAVLVLSQCIRKLDSEKSPLDLKALAQTPGDSDSEIENRLHRKFDPPNALKSPWLWAGAGLLVGLIIYNEKKSEKNNNQTTERVGF